MVESKGLKVGGLMTWWNCARFVRRQELRDGLEALGLGKHAPEPRTPPAALRSALEEVFPARTHSVEPLKRRDAFEVVEITRGEERNTFTHSLWVGIDKDESVEVKPFDMVTATRIVEAYNRHLGLVTANTVTQSLLGVLGSLQGTSLRERGALYWLPDSCIEEWRSVARVVENAPTRGGSTRVYLVRHEMDADAVRAVRDAITDEVRQATEKIHKDVLSGELGERALTHRQLEADELRAKIGLYEDMLNVGLGSLRADLDKAEEAATAARLLISSGAGEAVTA